MIVDASRLLAHCRFGVCLPLSFTLSVLSDHAYSIVVTGAEPFVTRIPVHSMLAELLRSA